MTDEIKVICVLDRSHTENIRWGGAVDVVHLFVAGGQTSVFEIRVGSVTSPSNETDWGSK